jgi:hypothetical protein
MDFRQFFKNGNAPSGKGKVDVQPLVEGCSLLVPNPQDPPAESELPYAISQALQQWLASVPPMRVRETLPIIRKGNMIGLFVWWDRFTQ